MTPIEIMKKQIADYEAQHKQQAAQLEQLAVATNKGMQALYMIQGALGAMTAALKDMEAPEAPEATELKLVPPSEPAPQEA